MKIEQFTEDARVKRVLAELDKQPPLKVSDLTDPDGRQYIDLVMEGGGVLGLALVGYAFVLEQRGIRFRSIGGTSAGAITACLLSACATPSEPRALRLLAMIADLDMFSFVDGGDDARDFVKDIIVKPRGLLFTLRAIRRNLDELFSVWGINPGDAFRDWIHNQLERCDAETTGKLDRLMNTWPAGMAVAGKPIDMATELRASLRLVTSEITTTTKVVLPEMGELFFAKPETVSPAEFVRASMSVPYFFEPYRVRGVPQGSKAAARWKERVGYTGELPHEVIFLDGGLMSNFPISLFHSNRVPRLPTFGVKLGRSRAKPSVVKGPVGMGGTMLSAARQASDLDFLWRNPDYKLLVGEIDLDANSDGKDDVHWLNFNLTDEEKIGLFAAGAEAARVFLMGDPKRAWTPFDWEGYKLKRAKLAEAAAM